MNEQTIIIFFLIVGTGITLFLLTLTLNRVLIYGVLFIGLRNAIELFALRYFDKQM